MTGGRLPQGVKIVRLGSGEVIVGPVAWSGAGRSALTIWNIPPAAKLGVYEVVVEREPKDGSATSSEDEDELLDRAWGLTPVSRLSCQAIVDGKAKLVVEIPRYTINHASERK